MGCSHMSRRDEIDDQTQAGVFFYIYFELTLN